jgi:hypothetical protein
MGSSTRGTDESISNVMSMVETLVELNLSEVLLGLILASLVYVNYVNYKYQTKSSSLPTRRKSSAVLLILNIGSTTILMVDLALATSEGQSIWDFSSPFRILLEGWLIFLFLDLGMRFRVFRKLPPSSLKKGMLERKE